MSCSWWSGESLRLFTQRLCVFHRVLLRMSKKPQDKDNTRFWRKGPEFSEGCRDEGHTWHLPEEKGETLCECGEMLMIDCKRVITLEQATGIE